MNATTRETLDSPPWKRHGKVSIWTYSLSGSSGTGAVSAAETGTESNAQAPKIGDELSGQYESGQYYLYLHQDDQPEAGSSGFDNWTWQSFVDGVLDEINRENATRYPQRTATQLHDLRDDIKNITDINDELTSEQETVKLYLEHVEAIEEVSATFDEVWESYSERWDGELVTSLGENASTNVHRTDGNGYPKVTVVRPDSEDED